MPYSNAQLRMLTALLPKNRTLKITLCIQNWYKREKEKNKLKKPVDNLRYINKEEEKKYIQYFGIIYIIDLLSFTNCVLCECQTNKNHQKCVVCVFAPLSTHNDNGCAETESKRKKISGIETGAITFARHNLASMLIVLKIKGFRKTSKTTRNRQVLFVSQ